MVRLYAVLCVVGAVLPLWFLSAFIADQGVDPEAFLDQISASNISLFAWADVVVTGLAVIAFAVFDRRRGWWWILLATLVVGPSLGLPLLLLLRERERMFDAVRAGG